MAFTFDNTLIKMFLGVCDPSAKRHFPWRVTSTENYILAIWTTLSEAIRKTFCNTNENSVFVASSQIMKEEVRFPSLLKIRVMTPPITIDHLPLNRAEKCVTEENTISNENRGHKIGP